jgi:competence protein ComEC
MIGRSSLAFHKYPTVTAFLICCAGILSGRAVDPAFLPWFLAALAITLVLLPSVLRAKETKLLWAAVALLVFLSGLAWALAARDTGRSFEPRLERQTVHATVSKILSSGLDFRVLLLTSGMNADNGTPLPGYGRLTVRDNRISLGARDRIAFLTRIRRPRNRGNPEEFDWELYCVSNGIFWLASVRGEDSILVVRRGSPCDPRVIAGDVRRGVTKFIESHSSGNVRAVLKGIVVGDRGEIHPGLRRAFSASGLAHVLSASGLHVGFVAILAFLLVSLVARLAPSVLLRVPYTKLAAAAAIPFVSIYCVLVGARIPAERATITALVFASAVLLERRWYSLNSLALAGLLILFVSPLSLYTPGFQLSFLAVFGILIAVPHLADRFSSGPSTAGARGGGAPERNLTTKVQRVLARVRRYVLGLVWTTLAATAAVSPILAATFHALPNYSVPANLLAVPMLMAALPLALLASAIGALWPQLGKWMLIPASGLLGWTISLAEFFASLPGSTLRMSDSGIAGLLLLTAMAATVLFLLRRPTLRRSAAVVGIALVTVSFFLVSSWMRSRSGDLEVVFLNVGKADAAFVRPPNSNGLLIDAGPRTDYFDAGESILIPFLSSAGVPSLEAAMISHPQMDHMGGLLSLMKTIRLSRIWWNDTGWRPPFMNRILAQAASRKIMVSQADRRTRPVRLGKATLRFANPPAGPVSRSRYSRDVNNAAVVCRLEYGDVSFLFTGDLEREGEAEMLRAGVPLGATVLKVGHHGCKSSSTLPFLEAVRPRIAVISSSDSPLVNCPDPFVLERLESLGAEVFWTGRDGAVTITTDGKVIRVRTGRNRKFRPLPSRTQTSPSLQKYLYSFSPWLQEELPARAVRYSGVHWICGIAAPLKK